MHETKTRLAKQIVSTSYIDVNVDDVTTSIDQNQKRRVNLRPIFIHFFFLVLNSCERPFMLCSSSAPSPILNLVWLRAVDSANAITRPQHSYLQMGFRNNNSHVTNDKVKWVFAEILCCNFFHILFLQFSLVITKLAVYRFVAKCEQNFDISTFCGVVGILEKHISIGIDLFESRMQLAI